MFPSLWSDASFADQIGSASKSRPAHVKIRCNSGRNTRILRSFGVLRDGFISSVLRGGDHPEAQRADCAAHLDLRNGRHPRRS